ncbi:MAG: ABC transporter ATP-binding protein [Lachnospiraceae bacterium]
MTKIFNYLWKHRGAVAIIIALLIIQAICDLSLPSYMSDIVDIGVSQSGIETAVPIKSSEDYFDALCLFMTRKDEDTVRQYYQLEDGIYEQMDISKSREEELNDIFSLPMMMLSYMESGEKQSVSPKQLLLMEKAGKIDRKTLLSMEKEAKEKYGSDSETMIAQVAVKSLTKEYTSIGVNIKKIQKEYLLKVGGKMLLLALIMMIDAIIAGYFSARVGAAIGKELREEVFTNVVSYSNREMEKFSAASLITRSTNDIQQIQMVSIMLLRMVMYAPIIGIGGAYKVIHTKTGMGWIIVVGVLLICALVVVLMKISLPKFKKMQSLIDRLNLVAREILTGVPVIRAFQREAQEEVRFEQASKKLMKTQLFTNRVMTFMMPAMMLIMNGITILIVWFGAHGVDLGKLQVGDMMAFITYTMMIVSAFLMLTMISIMLPRAGVAAARIDEVLTTETSIQDMEEVKDAQVKATKIGIAFEHVEFHYPDAEKNVISNIDFCAEAGKTTAIIGGTGCGKSTLLNLIPRFYDVTGGRITIDGVDIRELSQKKLRSLIGYAPQKGILFSGDITSNIGFGGEDVTKEQIQEAAEIAQALDFIEEKEEKFHSPIAQGGTNVSGGQKQRLSIARAIARHPQILLFDDTFSALDYQTDIALRKALYNKIKDATILIVAQRISTILHADRIIVLDEGSIVGIGTHEELMNTCETYCEIARSQLSEKELKGGRTE